jgi:hypothetical protein
VTEDRVQASSAVQLQANRLQYVGTLCARASRIPSGDQQRLGESRQRDRDHQRPQAELEAAAG